MKTKTYETDVLIIGSGVASAAISQRLLDHNPDRHIVILEASSRVKMRDFTLFQNYVANNLSNNGLPYYNFWDYPYPEPDSATNTENQSSGGTMIPLYGARLMMYGGSTVHWGGWSFRRKPEDFRLYSNTGKGIDWPITYDELEPYYCQAEDYIGVSGDSEDTTVPRTRPYPFREFPYTLEDGQQINAFKKLNIAYSHMPIARHGIANTDSPHTPCQTTGTCKYCPFGARYVAANFLDDMKAYNNYPNFHIRENVVVKNLIMKSKRQAQGAMCLDQRTGETFQINAKTVIVAAGSIESPKLLLNSKSSFWKAGVGNDNDIVGRNFVTHPYFVIQASIAKNPLSLQPEMGFPTLVTRYYDSKEEQAKGKFIFINPNTSPSVNLASWMQQGMTPQQIQQKVKGPTTVQMQGMVEVFTESSNYVQPLPSTNHVGLPQTLVNYTQAKDFNDRMKYITDVAARVFDALGGTNTTLQEPISWRADHASCTTRMSDDPTLGVVDRNLVIHGTDNVYVCSNASFSSLGAVNPTLTLTALSLRLADQLAKK